MNPISVQGLTKRYKRTNAVDDLTFNVRAGTVTGFLGRNGAGKTTTLKMLLGVVRPTSGTAHLNGMPYHQLETSYKTVGAMLDGRNFHPGRTGRNHLRWVAAAIGVNDQRVDELLAFVGLAEVGKKRVKSYSLGMRQRLSLAAALLGDPDILLLDEPANGLDPQGIRWLRDFLRDLASKGKTVLISSHVLAELAQFAEDAVVIEKGKLIYEGPINKLGGDQEIRVRVKTPRAQELADALADKNATIVSLQDGEFVVSGLSVEAVGDAALAAGIVVHSLNEEQDSLEDAFLRLTSGPDGAAAPAVSATEKAA